MAARRGKKKPIPTVTICPLKKESPKRGGEEEEDRIF